MKLVIKVTLILLALNVMTLYAGDIHKHSEHKQCNHDTLDKGISNTKINELAIKEVKRLVSKKKISKSWKSVPVSQIGRTHYGDNDDWIVAFNNPKVKKKKYQNLYIFVSKHGEIRGANYTGN